MTARMLHTAALALLLASPAWAQKPGPPPAQGAAGVVVGEPSYRVLRSVSGTKGQAQGGKYFIEDPRTIFYIPDDKQIIVYFEWEGPLGNHRFEALWKNPEGRVSVISDFSYEATQKKYGGYWTLILSDSVPTGLWTLEARIDGEAAGTHAFQILAAPRPAGAEVRTARLPLPPSEIYKRAVASTVAIEALDESGQKFNEGAGFLAGEGMVVTAFQVIDGARGLRIRLSDNSQRETDQVVAWNRWQDWAVLKIGDTTLSPLPRAEKSPEVGERVYTLDSPSAGSRTILDMDVIGKNTFGRAGDRLNVTNTVSDSGQGAPVLNEYGETVGVMGGSPFPGAGRANSQFNYIPISGLTTIRGGLAVPMALVKLAGSMQARLADLHLAGEMIPPLKRKHEIFGMGLTKVVENRSGTSLTYETRTEFTPRDKQFGLSLTVQGTEKGSSLVFLRIFDVDNRMVADGKPTKVNFKPGETRSLDWRIPLSNFRPGVYRVEVQFDQAPVWRTFMQVKE